MSLIAFHRFLISTAILFCLGLSIRQWSEFRTTGDGWTFVLAVVSVIAAVALGYYLAHLRHFLKIPSGEAGFRPSSHPRAFLRLADPRDEAESTPAVRSGNGGSKLRIWAASLLQPKVPPVKENGRNGRDHPA